MFAAQSGKNSLLFSNRIWFNHRSDSLRLTLYGYNFLVNECHLKCESFKLDRPLTNKILLQLDRLLPSVYFLLSSRNIIFIFEEEIIMLLKLLDGNIVTLLNNYQISS